MILTLICLRTICGGDFLFCSALFIGRACRIEWNPWQSIFRPDSDLGRKNLGMVKRANRDINPLGLFIVLEKNWRAAAAGKRAKSVGVPDLAQLAGEDFNFFFRNGTPCHDRRRTSTTTINAMTITESCWLLVQSVSHPTAQTAAIDLNVHFA